MNYFADTNISTHVHVYMYMYVKNFKNVMANASEKSSCPCNVMIL